MVKLEKNSLFPVEITGYSSDGAGVARIGGQVVFVKNALEGEKCVVRILKVGKSAAWAKIENMLEPSLHRVTPGCPVFSKCGGCDLMHMDYEEELRFKKQRVEDALRRIGGIDVPASEILGAEERTGYRNKAIFAVGGEQEHIVTGFFRERSHDIVPVESCAIQAEVSNRAAAAVREWMKAYGVPAYNEEDGTGLVRHVFCRFGFVSGQAQITVVAASDRLPEQDKLVKSLRQSCPEAVGILLNINRTRGNTVLSVDYRTLWGEDTVEDELCSLRFRLSPASFYQINHTQAEKLYGKTLEYAGLTGSETVLDLYCGTGTITLYLARNAGKAIGAEIVEKAVQDAQENAERNGITNATFLCADAAQAAEKLREDGLRPDVIVVDPPRKGLQPEVIGHIADMVPESVVYVSCDPATLARDLRIFEEKGYRTQRVTAVDMFPCTAHVETVVLMSRVKDVER